LESEGVTQHVLTRHPSIVCLSCRGSLPFAGGDEIRCPNCDRRYAVHFGIPDMREGLQVAGMAFDVLDDLRRARALYEELRGVTYRDWFFGTPERVLSDAAGDERRAQREQRYFQAERETFGIHGEHVLAKVDDYLRSREPERLDEWSRASVALEVGCGTGQYPIGFAQRFQMIVVADLSYVALVQAQAIARDFSLTGVRLIAANLERLPIADGTIDFINCSCVVEHVNDPERAFAECSRVLSEQGLAYIQSPNRYSLYFEPHFGIPGFGFWPMGLRKWLSYRASGHRSFEGTNLRSLRELRGLAARAFPRYRIYWLPPQLRRTARGGLIRSVIVALLNAPVVGRAADVLLNRVLLSIAPYHIVLASKR
jgi:SAM-dependent methyltransferase